MFFKLVARNSKRNRIENGLFFSSLVISIVAFYIVLALPRQDVMLFLAKMESDAVNRLMTLIPIFYGLTLVILFFLIYYASKYQMERRRHEFGVYLMMGMGRGRLFGMLLAEDVRGSGAALILGLPMAVLLSELISLITARLVGMGIVGHQISFSLKAVIWTACGFVLIKLAAFLILSGKIARQEIGALLTDMPKGTKKQRPAQVYAAAMTAGILCLCAAYGMALRGWAWYQIKWMGITVALGFVGTMLLLYGLRFFITMLATRNKKNRRLHVFNFRQIQETVIYHSGTLAVCSMLILASMCCFGAGVAIAGYYGQSEFHVLDYTFSTESTAENGVKEVRERLSDYGLDDQFEELLEMRVGYIRTVEDYDDAYQMDSVMTMLDEMEPSEDRDVLLNNLSYAEYPYLIQLSGYNRLLSAAGLPELELEAGEAAVYMDQEFTNSGRTKMLNQILERKPEVQLDGESYHLTGTLQTTNLVTDRSLTLSFALIVPDEAFAYYTQGDYDTYLNGILNRAVTGKTSLMTAISDMNEKLDQTGLQYESYLQNIGRQLFYMVAASYITIYLAIIFLLIANTVIGVQFLMGQQKQDARYRTLIRLGAGYKLLCKSAGSQINWYFGIPVVVAAISSIFGVRALLVGLLPSRTQGSISEMLLVSGVMILVLCVVEWIYITVVKGAGKRHLLTLIVPEREE